jgi:UV DNA damage endonuclease
VPKIHLSSPKDRKNFRGHADYIDSAFFVDFLETAQKTRQNFDVMLEAKNKDLALFKLMKDLESIKWIKFLDQASIEI